MEKFKPFKPSKQEVKKAEEMMTPEEKRMTKKRAENIISSEILKQGELLGHQLVLRERLWAPPDDIEGGNTSNDVVDLIWGDELIYRIDNSSSDVVEEFDSVENLFDLLIQEQVDPIKAGLTNFKKIEKFLKKEGK